MTLLSIAFSLFLLMDPVGNIPFYLSFLKGIPARRQRIIIIRELVIALGIIIIFNFIGNGLMRFLHVEQSTIQIGGGIILFLLCLKMIFPHSNSLDEHIPNTAIEPFIVPLAIPLVAGPGVLAAVMIYAKQSNEWIGLGAIIIAWAASLMILISSSWLKSVLGTKGILATERLMGLILTLISIQMFLSGIRAFINV